MGKQDQSQRREADLDLFQQRLRGLRTRKCADNAAFVLQVTVLLPRAELLYTSAEHAASAQAQDDARARPDLPTTDTGTKTDADV